MKNINFDNPLYLLFLIPLLLLIVVPYAISVGKENRNWHIVTSFVIHIAISCMVVLAVVGTTYTTVITKTEVYFVADVSGSSRDNLDTVDAYIEKVSDSLPRNSDFGIVCFGKDYVLHTEMGKKPRSVKDAKVDDSATNISDALRYTESLFREDTIKRIVLITDGKETDSKGTDALIRAIAEITSKGIYLDAMYLDNNLKEGTAEAQVSGVDFTPSTFLGQTSRFNVLVEASVDTEATLTLLQNGNDTGIHSATRLTKGYNIVNFEVPCDQDGTFTYEVVLEAEKDTSPDNNIYTFVQEVAGKMQVFFLSEKKEDLEAMQALLDGKADITGFTKPTKYGEAFTVPYTVEELSRYDQFILSGVDVREIENHATFVKSLDTVVSEYGKSLITLGDVGIQNQTDTVLKDLEDMLPVRFGEADNDTKLYGIVLDTSRSMENASRFQLAKQAAISLLEILKDNDYVAVVSFSGDTTVVQRPVKLAGNREKIAELINGIAPTQGTFMGKAMSEAYQMLLPFSQIRDKQVMLISDGKSSTLEHDDPVEEAGRLLDAGIPTSVINPGCMEGEPLLLRVALRGTGKYFYAETEEQLSKVMFQDVADNVTETVVEGDFSLTVKKPTDTVLYGIDQLPHINGFIRNSAKNQANTVLTVEYKKASGRFASSPIYAWWNYGEGKVATFASSFTGDWKKGWDTPDAKVFGANLSLSNIPGEQHRVPYTLYREFTGTELSLEIIPATLSEQAAVSVTLTHPNGDVETQTLSLRSNMYAHTFAASQSGLYQLHISYTWGNHNFETDSVFHTSYPGEYDRFLIFSPYELNRVMLSNGTVSEDGELVLQNDPDEVATYVIDFAIPLLVLAVVLFFLDVCIRKLKWEDIRGLFGSQAKSKKGGKP